MTSHSNENIWNTLYMYELFSLHLDIQIVKDGSLAYFVLLCHAYSILIRHYLETLENGRKVPFTTSYYTDMWKYVQLNGFRYIKTVYLHILNSSSSRNSLYQELKNNSLMVIIITLQCVEYWPINVSKFVSLNKKPNILHKCRAITLYL